MSGVVSVLLCGTRLNVFFNVSIVLMKSNITSFSFCLHQDVDTIYLSQDSRELCLQDFDHLSGK